MEDFAQPRGLRGLSALGAMRQGGAEYVDEPCRWRVFLSTLPSACSGSGWAGGGPSGGPSICLPLGEEGGPDGGDSP